MSNTPKHLRLSNSLQAELWADGTVALSDRNCDFSVQMSPEGFEALARARREWMQQNHVVATDLTPEQEQAVLALAAQILKEKR